MVPSSHRKKTQGGNVLFLILIAVALFAALSYVVTQSTRSGSGSTDREKNILSGAQMTQYPTQLRTSLIRMILGGAAVENIRFNQPGSFGVSSDLMVFHPQGGGATFQDGPAELGTTGVPLTWYYNANFWVPGVGIDTAGGNDVIAFLPGVSQGVCKQVNEELGVTLGTCTPDVSGGTIPQISTSVTSALIKASAVGAPMAPVYTFPTALQVELQCTSGTAFRRMASGCFYSTSATEYVFYSVLLER